MTSMKKLLAATAACVPLVGSAQTPPPETPPLAQIYGTLNVNLQVTGAPGAHSATTGARDSALSIKPREAVSVDSTNLGVKGAAHVGQDVSVVYQCETSANVDGVGVSGICNRNSRLGLSSPIFGTLFYGNWDSPYKGAAFGTKADDAFGNTDVYDEGSMISNPGFNTRSASGQTAAAPAAFGAANNPGLQFNVRAANSVAYHSPKIMGLSAKAQWSVSEFADAKYRRAPELYSAVVNYDLGPISAFATFEDHEDWLSQNSRDQGLKFGLGYELGTPFGTTTLAGKWEQLWYKDATASFFTGLGIEKYDRQAFAVDFRHRMGNHELRARYMYADSGNAHALSGAKISTSGLGAWNVAIGYAYYLTKAAQVYLFWTQIENSHRAQYTFSTSGPAFDTAVPAGADPWAAGLGLRYAF